ncbi:MAG: DUF3261 domain-containing protein [Alphaproteobacteria bacterium]|nr:DUF3261 domain-containing protein [Alphaproteobacteria bacterium]
MMQRATFLALLLLLTSCTTSPAPVSPEEAAQPMIAPKQLLTLPRPADLGRSVQAVQLITFRRDNQTMVFEGHLSITPERLLLVGIDSLGRRAMTLTWTEAGLATEAAPWLPSAVRPGSMLADIVLLYWPAAAIRASLPPGGELVESAYRRQILLDGKPVLNIEYGFDITRRWTGRLHYANFSWGYQIEVQSAEASP